jgi:hypothetical protein
MRMTWRIAVYAVASFLVITLPARAQPSTISSTRPPKDQSSRSSQISVADQELIRRLEEAGYTQVRDDANDCPMPRCSGLVRLAWKAIRAD